MKHAAMAMILSLGLALGPAATPQAAADGALALRPLSGSGGYSGSSYSYSATPYQASGYNSSAYTSRPLTSEAMPLRGRVSTLPKGSTMIVKLDQPLSSYSSNLGDTISATVENSVFANDMMAIPAGSAIIGQIVNVTRAKRLGRHGEVDVRFFQVKTPDGSVIPLQGHVVTKDNTGALRGDTYTMDLIKGVGTAAGGTALGAVAGTAVGGLLGVAGTGAAMGTGVGAIAGMGYAVARKGKDVVIPSGARMSIKVDEAASLNN